MDLKVAMEIVLLGLTLVNKAVGEPISKQIVDLMRDYDEENAKPFDQIDDRKLASIHADFMRLVPIYKSAIMQKSAEAASS